MILIKKINKTFALLKNSCIFALRLTMQASIQVLLIAAFFIATNQNSTGCCISSGSRYLALLTLAKSENNSLLYFKNIFNPTMQASIKNASRSKHSRAAIAKNNTITLTLTGVAGNHCKHALRKINYEFLINLTHRDICAKLRFVEKYEAANLLYPKERKALRNQKIIIKLK